MVGSVITVLQPHIVSWHPPLPALTAPQAHLAVAGSIADMAAHHCLRTVSDWVLASAAPPSTLPQSPDDRVRPHQSELATSVFREAVVSVAAKCTTSSFTRDRSLTSTTRRRSMFHRSSSNSDTPIVAPEAQWFAGTAGIRAADAWLSTCDKDHIPPDALAAVVSSLASAASQAAHIVALPALRTLAKHHFMTGLFDPASAACASAFPNMLERLQDGMRQCVTDPSNNGALGSELARTISMVGTC